MYNSNSADLIPTIAAKVLNLNLVVLKIIEGGTLYQEFQHGKLNYVPTARKNEMTPKRLCKKLDFKSGFFLTPAPGIPSSSIGNRNLGTDQENCNVVLILYNDHYRYLLINELIDLLDNGNAGVSKCISDLPIKSEMSKPTLVLPFISQEAAEAMRDIYADTFPNRPFNICFKNESKISGLIKPVGGNLTNTKKDSDLIRTGAVYKITCLKCDSDNVVSTYVGETSRMLGIRIKEHLAVIKNDEDLVRKEKNLSMFQLHAYKKHSKLDLNDIKIEVLITENNTQARKVKEAIQISAHKPTLNNNKG